jgi:hypothetical protein
MQKCMMPEFKGVSKDRGDGSKLTQIPVVSFAKDERDRLIRFARSCKNRKQKINTEDQQKCRCSRVPAVILTFVHCSQLVHGCIGAPLMAQGAITTPLEQDLPSEYAFASATWSALSCLLRWAFSSL